MMGRGNVCVFGEHEGLYYIDNEDFLVYRREDDYGDGEVRYLRLLDAEDLSSGEWELDEWFTENEKDDILYSFAHDFTRDFPSFESPHSDKWLDRTKRILLESGLFYIVIEDNEWSIAVELIQKDDEAWMAPLQGRLAQKYLSGMKGCLLKRLPGVGVYTGPWTSGRIMAEETISNS